MKTQLTVRRFQDLLTALNQFAGNVLTDLKFALTEVADLLQVFQEQGNKISALLNNLKKSNISDDEKQKRFNEIMDMEIELEYEPLSEVKFQAEIQAARYGKNILNISPAAMVVLGNSEFVSRNNNKED